MVAPAMHSFCEPTLKDGLEIRMEAQENNCDAKADSGQISTGVEILLSMSHNTLTTAEEYIQ